MAGELTDNELEWRRHGLGASDIPCLFQMGFQTPIEVWAAKLWGHTVEVTPLMQRGHDLEPIVAAKWVAETGHEVTDGGMVWSLRCPRLFATLDYWAVGGWPLECKVVDYWAADGWDNGPPKRVVVQAHTQRLVTGAPKVTVAALFVDSWELRWWDIHPDPAVDTAIVRWATEFWDTYVVARRPPPVTAGEADGRALGLIPVEAGAEAELDGRLVGEWRAAKAEAKEWGRRASEYRAEILAAMNGATKGLVDGTHTVTLSSHGQGGKTVVRLLEVVQ